jgi:excisionase family DNA binding protein
VVGIHSESQKLAYRVDEAIQVSGLGRTFLYEHIANGQLPSVKIGGCRLILHDDLLAFLKGAAASTPKIEKPSKPKARRPNGPLPRQIEFQWR